MLLYYLSSLIFLFLSLIMFMFSMLLMLKNMIYFFEWELLNLNSFNFIMYLYFDWMSLMFIFTVLIITSMIMLYSSEYMSHDLNYERFYYLMMLFMISMIFLIISPSMVSILLGWDGLGLISYCLVIYYQNYYSYNCGMLTILLNRIGDVLIIMSIVIMFSLGSWNFMNFNNFNMNILIILIIICSFTKSAQFPFSSWLPAAMAAPTPVSSLVHSSTLVTAGIYLLIRFHYLVYKSELNNYILIFGLITMFMSGMCAVFEFDMKKIIAFSTLSQLGLMMMIYSMKFYYLTFFHLVIHAMFKSMMFMCSGVFIHSMINYQDIRFFGKMFDYMPLTSMMLMISNFSLCGLPFMSGFYSKDYILEMMVMNKLNLMIYFFLIISTMLTVYYSIRLMYYMMNFKFNFFSMSNIKDYINMNISMIILMIFSIFFGWLINWLMFYNIEYIYLLKIEKNMILLICLFSLLIFFVLMKFNLLKINLFMYSLGKMFFFYNFNKLIIYYPLKFGKYYFNLSDKLMMNLFFEDIFYYFYKKFNKNYLMNNLLIIMILMLFYFMMLIYLMF